MPRFRTVAFSSALLSILLLSTFCSAQQAPILVTQPVDDSARTVLKNNVHSLARPEFDQGEAPASMTLHRLLLVLKRSAQQEAALRHLVENQQNKQSPSYHQWLTPEQFGKQFGPPDSDIAAVTNWLSSSGFAVNSVNRGRTFIEFDGTAGLIKQAFGTSLHRYLINGEEHIANSTDPSVPTALAPVIAGFDSLHDFRRKAQNVYVGRYDFKKKQLESPAPGYTFSSGQSTFYAIGPYDFATIYDELPLWNATPAVNGTGVTIAIVGRTDIDPTDATDFWSLFGLDGTHAPQPSLKIIINGPDPGFTPDEAEADIDTQWSGAAAPGATIDYVTSESTETTDGVDLSALYIVDNNLAPVMSESYGNCEASGVGNFYGSLWEQAAAQGISAMVSTGDNGSAGCDDPNSQAFAVNGKNVNGIASTPWNAAIGGTDFNQPTQADLNAYWNPTNASITQESAKSYIPELTWNDSCANPLLQLLSGGSTSALTNCNNPNFSGFLDISAGSGGASGSGLGAGFGWLKPTWQTGLGVPNDNARDLPDVSLFASNGFLGSFYIICQKDQTGGVCNLTSLSFLGYGGTSVASPAFAGIMALVNQKWGPQGVPGLVLYNLASKQSTAFHDLNIVSGTSNSPSTNAVPCQPGSTSDCTSNGQTYGVLNGYSTNAGYDLATGLGSVDANVLVTNWNKVTFTPSTTTLVVNGGSPVSVTHGSAVPVKITVAPQSGSGTPTGDVALMVAPGTPGKPGIDWNTLSGGTISWSTNLLPGGTYQVIAHYSGDTAFGGSYSPASSSITVNPENSVVYMPGVVTGTDQNGNPTYSTSVTYGTGATDVYWLRADVQNSQSQFCTSPSQGEIACPTGTVTVTSNGQPIDGGTFKLNSFGYTEDQAAQLPGGTDTVVANYSGDASFKASSQSTVITVKPAATSLPNVGVLNNPASVFAGQPFTAGVTVVTPPSYGAAPTGTVTFLANGTALPGTATYTPTAGNFATGTAAAVGVSLNTSISTPGTYTITATYTSGDGNYSSQSSSSSAQLVVLSNQTIALPTGPLAAPAAANPGQQTTTTMLVQTSDGQVFAANPIFTCPAGLPTGATCSFSPNLQGLTSPQTVTITVKTAGPFTGTAGGAVHGMRRVGTRRAKDQNPRLWLPLSLPMAGVVLVGLAGRRIPRHCQIAGLCLTLLLAGFLVACGGGGSAAPVVVNVNPSSVNTLFPNNMGAGEPAQTQQFSATVTSASNTAVTWTISSGGTTDSISSSGLYTAPNSVPTGPVTITATSQADTTKTGNATVTIQTPTPAGTFQITVQGTENSQTPQTTNFNLTVN